MSTYIEQRRAMKNGQMPTSAQAKKEAKPTPLPKQTAPLKKNSKKGAKVNRQYAKVSKPLWKEEECQAKLKGCTGMAQGMHHLEGKETAEKKLNMKKAIPCCNHCNTEIERLHALAADKGLRGKRNQETTRYKDSYKK